jgi:hypothetical protein
METKAASALPRWPFRFDPEKALESVLFVIPRLRDPTLHSVSKILYQADREHMQRYARPISGDRYCAMEHGQVPSAIYDVLKAVKAGRDLSAGFAESLRVENGRQVVALREPRLDVLSPSELECLATSAAEHGHKTFGQLADESHDAAWEAAGDNELVELEHFLLTLSNAAELREHFTHD